MKKITLLLALFGAQLVTFGQATKSFSVALPATKPCAQHEVTSYMQQNDPQRYAEYEQARLTMNHEAHSAVEKAGTVYTIPVVFHILHNNGSENISDAQIQNALNILNRDFRKQNTDVNNVVAQFLPLAGDVEIEFAFAKVAPNGTCFNGITRTQSTQTNNGTEDGGLAQVNAVIAGNNVYQGVWPHNKYLNIFVCKNLVSGAAGYTFLPNGNSAATAENMYYNGIFMLHNYTGSIGTSSVYTSRALTHEVGHWLNLSHIWGNGNIGTCGDDFVADTPKTNGSNGVCTLTKTSCDASLDNVENYMDYSYCSKMFTNGQVSRMRSAITSSIAGRSNIWTQTNLQNTGVIPGGSSACSAGIQATQTAICAGTSTNFSVVNVSGTITSYAWSFPGGSPATSSQANPTVTYNTPGTYNVSCVITISGNNTTITQNSYITVASSSTGQSLPFTEGFSSTSFPPTNWTLDNGGNASVTWKRNNAGKAPSGAGSAVIDNYTNDTSGDVDDLNSPAINLTGVTSATLTFDVAYKPYSSSYADKLEVLVAAGCGASYTVVYSKAGTALQTETANQTAYTAPTTWRNETIDLTPYVGNNQVKIKFRNTSDWGNFIYLDNVNVTGATGGAANANFTPSATSKCEGQSITFTDASTGATSWSWNFGAGATPATATGAGPHTVTYSTSGTKTISLSINNGASSSNQNVVINAKPSVSLANLPTVCINHGAITLNQGSPAGGSYSGPGVSGNQFTPATAGVGSKTITYTYSNVQGCSNTASKQILVDQCLGLENEEGNFLSVFPNPTRENVHISSSIAITSVLITDNVGRIVQAINNINATDLTIDLSNLATGSYHLHTQQGNEIKMTKLVVH
jgi:PKD repeat protein